MMDSSIHIAAANVYSFIGGIALGSIGTLIGIRVTNSKKISATGSVVDQSKARAGGDIVGRDKRGS